jgi:hypothetical protein
VIVHDRRPAAATTASVLKAGSLRAVSVDDRLEQRAGVGDVAGGRIGTRELPGEIGRRPGLRRGHCDDELRPATIVPGRCQRSNDLDVAVRMGGERLDQAGLVEKLRGDGRVVSRALHALGDVVVDRAGGGGGLVGGVNGGDVATRGIVERRAQTAGAERGEHRARLAKQAQLVVGLAEVEVGQRIGRSARGDEDRERFVVALELVERRAEIECKVGRSVGCARDDAQLDEGLVVPPRLERPDAEQEMPRRGVVIGADAARHAQRKNHGAKQPHGHRGWGREDRSLAACDCA